ncbi:redox-sensing transcriptional repressor Rex [Candidatus Aerophobetes bacterium]|uniref:Redox-sensing transcriptional repressor Rex n=1 Tax=Aerophobetes bacterium TaxID=2030807 RepID=A0A523ULN1_UNCAE|nr:MAG: redox-sensing transcriptional repressor Rex [Candidatus Aerophobetes bacterium]
MPRFKVPEATVERLSVYLRSIKRLKDERVLPSQELAELVGTSDGQVRKDLAYFGEFGVPGQGYRVGTLKEEISRILGVDRAWRIALVGMGNLGAALLAYPGFKRQGFEIKVAFDNDLSKIGKVWQGVKIEDVEKIPQILFEQEIKMGIIATPAQAAQAVASKLIEGGVKAILNFAPVRIVVPDRVKLRNVDLSIELEALSYFLGRKGIAGG